MSQAPELTATIFDIQRFSVHDGPGIRTTVFFKGCNLRCAWCHNPESLRPTPEVMVYPDKCVGCGACAKACAIGAPRFDENGPAIDRARCTGCLACAGVCFSGALSAAGKAMSVSQVLDVVRRDVPFYESSGGGMTISGGEALLQSEFAAELLHRARTEGIHTTVDTALAVSWEHVAKVLPHTDLFLVDIKAAGSALHRRLTGIGNERILKNLRRLVGLGAQVWVRIPLVPGAAGDEAELAAIARILADIPGIQRIELLNFHRMGEGKYRALGMEYAAAELNPISAKRVNEMARVFEDAGIETLVVLP